jgi:DNA topoisomerase-1
MKTEELKKAHEAIEMLQKLDLPIGEEQRRTLMELEKAYLEKEVLPAAINTIRPMFVDLKTSFQMTLKYSEKDGLLLEGVEAQKEAAKEAIPGNDTDEGRYLGVDSESGKKVYVKVTSYGLLAQLGDSAHDKKPKYVRLKRGTSLDDVTLSDVLTLFKFPRNLGFFEGFDVLVGVGPYGPYVKHNEKYYNLSREDDPNTIEYDRAVEIILTKRELGIGAVILEFEQDPNIRVINGRFGPYIKYKKNNYKVPRQMTPSLLSYEDCLAIINDPANAAQKWVPRNKQE